MIENPEEEKNDKLVMGEDLSSPLIVNNPSQAHKIVFPRVNVVTYDENEDTTCVDEAILLESNAFKQWFIVPLFSILTLFVWPVFLYWRKPMQRDWLYSLATDIQTA